MVEKIVNLLNKEFGGLHGPAILLAGSAFLSQLLALLRDRLLASGFGAGSHLDVYYAAFKIPDFLFVIIGSFLSITVIIPILVNRVKNDDNNKEAKRFLSGLLSFFFLFFVASASFLFFLIPWASFFLAPGFDELQRAEFIQLTRVMLLSPFFFGVSGLIGSVSQVFKRFIVYALGPVLYNIGVIFGIIFLFPKLGLIGLAYGVVLGAFMHMLVQLPVVLRTGLVPLLVLKMRFDDIRFVVSRSSPRTVALGSSQLSLMVIVAIASLMRDGSISVFNFAFNLQSVPLAVVGISYSVAALPNLSDIFASKKMGEFMEYVETAFRHILFWSIPAMVLFVVLRAQIVRVILGAGQFDWVGTRLTAAALAIFALSVASQSITNLLSMGYYSAGLTKRPVLARLTGSFIVVILAVLFVLPFGFNAQLLSFLETIFRISGLPGTNIVLLVFAFSFGNIITSFIIIYNFKRDFGSMSLGLGKTIFQIVVASLFMGGVAYMVLNLFVLFFAVNTFWSIFFQGLSAGLIGLVFSFLLLYWFKNRALFELIEALHKKFWKNKVISSPEKDL